MKHEKVCIVGLGYIGLPTAGLLASRGHTVHGVDTNSEVVSTINSGAIHIVEPDLDVVIHGAVSAGRLKASLVPEKADVFMLAVPTPFYENREPNLAYVKEAARSIAPYLEQENLVILESTSPVGTTEMVAGVIGAERPDLETVYFAHCPERVLPGHVLKELVENDRVVGGLNKSATEQARSFYSTFVNGEILATDARTAELSKLTENAFRDVNIAFANEMSLVCDRLGINPWELIRLSNRHPRVNILQPGPGVGGHCIAVDPWFIVASAPEQTTLMRAARSVNESKPSWVVNKTIEVASEIQSPTILCLGLAFKANIDDLRESPAVEIVRGIKRDIEADVLVCEPYVEQSEEFDLVSVDEGLRRADVVVLLVDHREFKRIPETALAGKRVIDTRGIWA